VESDWVHSALRPQMAYCASPGWLWWRNWWNDWQGKPKYSEKTCPSAALSTTNPTCCPDANRGRHGRKPATNRVSYGTVYHWYKMAAWWKRPDEQYEPTGLSLGRYRTKHGNITVFGNVGDPFRREKRWNGCTCPRNARVWYLSWW
jgi:hypothetical protein